MPNIFKNQEQRLHWNEYNANYSKKNYRNFCIKLSRKNDAEIIAYLDQLLAKESMTSIVRRLLTKEMKG